MREDRRGLAVTTESDRAVACFDEAVRSFLAHRHDAADHLAQALAHDPDLVVAHCFSGFSVLLLGHGELFALVRASADRAGAVIAERGATARERGLHAALVLWLEGEMEQSASVLEAMLHSHKLDGFAVKLLHALYFILGDAAGMRRVAESISDAWQRDVPEAGFILGCHAFALEEAGEIAAAERRGREAIAIENEDVWAIHAVAHAYESSHRAKEGITWLSDQASTLAGVNNFAGHLHWHRALFHLALGDSAAALSLYDTKIRTAGTDDYRDITNAASLLSRLKCAGCDVGNRWEELADLAERRIADRALVFAQVNYLLCLIGAGRRRPASALRDHLRQWGDKGKGTQAQRATLIGVPLAEALLHRHGDTENRRLRRLLPLVGGSHAQRATFMHILDAAITTPSALPADVAWRTAKRDDIVLA